MSASYPPRLRPLQEIRHPHLRPLQEIKYPHRYMKTFWAVIRRFALFILVLMIICALLASLFDIGLQLIRSNRASKVSDTIVTFATYVSVFAIGVAILIKRAISGRIILSSIPKGYLPIGRSDLPKKAYQLISNEYDRASVIAHVSQPKGRRQEGWGRPGTEYENVHFRTSILSTISMLHGVIAPLFPDTSLPLSTPRASSLSPMAPLLRLRPCPIPEALNPLADLYEQHLVRAKYDSREPEEEEWDEVVKIVAVLVGVLSGLQSADPGGGDRTI